MNYVTARLIPGQTPDPAYSLTAKSTKDVSVIGKDVGFRLKMGNFSHPNERETPLS
jgi:hypothetical protein